MWVLTFKTSMSNISVSWYRLSWLHTINSSQKGWNSANPPLMLGGGGGVGDRITRNRPTSRPIWHYTRLFTTNSGIIKGPWSGRFTRKGRPTYLRSCRGSGPADPLSRVVVTSSSDYSISGVLSPRVDSEWESACWWHGLPSAVTPAWYATLRTYIQGTLPSTSTTTHTFTYRGATRYSESSAESCYT